jgi:hypothetical protein
VHVALLSFSSAGARLSVDPDCSQLRVPDPVLKAIVQPAFVCLPPLRHGCCPSVVRVLRVVARLVLVSMGCCTRHIVVVAGVGGLAGSAGLAGLLGLLVLLATSL